MKIEATRRKNNVGTRMRRIASSGRAWLAVGILATGVALGCSPVPGPGAAKREAPRVVGNTPGVAAENGTELLIALPIENTGPQTAHRVTLSEIRLHGGHRDLPAYLPMDLGTIAPGQRAVAQLRFNVPGLNPAQSYELEVEGRYHYRDKDDSDKDDRARNEDFHYQTRVHLPPGAPGSATAGTNHGITHHTTGPYPALPQPEQTESNDNRPPTPEGSPRVVFPKTAQKSGILDPGITTYPGIASGGAAVGFVINTESDGIANRFPPDPSAIGTDAASNVVLMTGNLYMKYSTDGGSTFTTISNLSTVFGDQPDGGYCCDQVVHYVPSIDRIVWLIQTNQVKDSKGNTTGPNSQRVAWAKPSDIAANFFTAWTWFDVSSTFLGLGNDWLDYPDVSTASGHLYISTDDVTKGGLVVARISFSDMQLPPGNNVTWDFTDPANGTNAVASHLTQNATATMYWGGHNGTSKFRVFLWGDSSNQYSWHDADNTSYSTSDYTSKATDGQFWLDPRPKGDAVVGAAFTPIRAFVAPGSPAPPNQIWFAWTAGRDKDFPQPYVRMVMIDDQNFKAVGEFETWNSSYSFAYPALAVNSATSEVAISLMWGGAGTSYMNHAAGFPQDFLLYITTASNVTFTANPKTATQCDDVSGGTVSGRCTRSGDYLGLRRVGTNSGLFGTAGYEIDLVDSTKSTDCLKAPGCLQNVRWIVFGRPSDVLPPPPGPH
jgi:hypothetical protein